MHIVEYWSNILYCCGPWLSVINYGSVFNVEFGQAFSSWVKIIKCKSKLNYISVRHFPIFPLRRLQGVYRIRRLAWNGLKKWKWWYNEKLGVKQFPYWNSVFGYTALKRLKIHCTKVIKMKRICYLDFINLFHANQVQVTLLVQSQ